MMGWAQEATTAPSTALRTSLLFPNFRIDPEHNGALDFSLLAAGFFFKGHLDAWA